MLAADNGLDNGAKKQQPPSKVRKPRPRVVDVAGSHFNASQACTAAQNAQRCSKEDCVMWKELSYGLTPETKALNKQQNITVKFDPLVWGPEHRDISHRCKRMASLDHSKCNPNLGSCPTADELACGAASCKDFFEDAERREAEAREADMAAAFAEIRLFVDRSPNNGDHIRLANHWAVLAGYDKGHQTITKPIRTGQWMHVAVVIDPLESVARLSVDGGERPTEGPFGLEMTAAAPKVWGPTTGTWSYGRPCDGPTPIAHKPGSKDAEEDVEVQDPPGTKKDEEVETAPDWAQYGKDCKGTSRASNSANPNAPQSMWEDLPSYMELAPAGCSQLTPCTNMVKGLKSDAFHLSVDVRAAHDGAAAGVVIGGEGENHEMVIFDTSHWKDGSAAMHRSTKEGKTTYRKIKDLNTAGMRPRQWAHVHIVVAHDKALVYFDYSKVSTHPRLCFSHDLTGC